VRFRLGNEKGDSGKRRIKKNIAVWGRNRVVGVLSEAGTPRDRTREDT